ncbi:hypothetical protein Mal64_18150 [Pseudobythopirellula maris]|uniref:Activator of Hsp90 ATPase homologue 1/2-like C-terminal domain-containing protein n=1 Tax=Pseudobythopirellula maris TaxID=2527991 RepID=A0A5C5ZML8_9BACT|nr:SRPBCC family protein [Pseudobythopirellula maris]TWT88336.1 hypothetical protein Mal64_18150 [Pseudobythopirellula maris]
MVARSKPNEIRITREYDAPVAMVWDAWADPEQVAQWWGPRGFTITTHSKELRVGGVWRYTMHGPDGTDWPNTTVYHEVVEHEKLVYDHGGSEDRPPLFRVTVLFVERDGKTLMDMTMALPTPEEAEATRVMIKEKGGNGTWDRLAEYLADRKGVSSFVINRSFDAPRDAVFAMWIDPEHFANWLPPNGCEMEFLRSDVREGGESFYRWISVQQDFSIYVRLEYHTIDVPNRLVYVQRLCDENGRPAKHPILHDFPEAMLTTVDLKEEGPNATRVTLTWAPQGEATAEEVQAFLDTRSSMTQGWTGSFDKLEGVLLSTRSETVG